MSRSRKRCARRNKKRADPNADLFESSDEEERKVTLTPDSNWKELQFQAYLRSRMRNGRHRHDVQFVDSNDRPVSLAERIVRFRLTQSQRSPHQAGSNASMDKKEEGPKLQDLLQQYIQQRQSEDALSSNLLSEINNLRTTLQDDDIVSNLSTSKGRISQSISLGDSATDFNLKLKNYGNVSEGNGEINNRTIEGNIPAATQNEQKDKSKSEIKPYLHDTLVNEREDIRKDHTNNFTQFQKGGHHNVRDTEFDNKITQKHKLSDDNRYENTLNDASCEKTTSLESFSGEQDCVRGMKNEIQPDDHEIKRTLHGKAMTKHGSLEKGKENILTENKEIYHEIPANEIVDEGIVKNTIGVKIQPGVTAKRLGRFEKAQEPIFSGEGNASKEEPLGLHIFGNHDNCTDCKQINDDCGERKSGELVETHTKDYFIHKEEESLKCVEFSALEGKMNSSNNIDNTDCEGYLDRELRKHPAEKENRSKTFIISSSSSKLQNTKELTDAIDHTSLKTAGSETTLRQIQSPIEEAIHRDDTSKGRKEEDYNFSDLNGIHLCYNKPIHAKDTFSNETASTLIKSKAATHFNQQTSIKFSLQAEEDVKEFNECDTCKYDIDSDSDDLDIFCQHTESIRTTVFCCAHSFPIKPFDFSREKYDLHLPLIEKDRNIIKHNFAKKSNDVLLEQDRPSCIGSTKRYSKSLGKSRQRKAHIIPTMYNDENSKMNFLQSTNPVLTYSNKTIPNASLQEDKSISDRGNRIASIYQKLRERNGSHNSMDQSDACGCYLRMGMEWGFMSMPHDSKRIGYRHHKGLYPFINNKRHHLTHKLPVNKESPQNSPQLSHNEFIYLRDVSFSRYSHISTGEEDIRKYINPLSWNARELIGSSEKETWHAKKRENKGKIGLHHHTHYSKGIIGYTVLPALKRRKNIQVKRDPDR